VSYQTSRSYQETSYSKDITIRGLACTGSEADISLCASYDWDTGTKYCDSYVYDESVGIDCRKWFI